MVKANYLSEPSVVTLLGDAYKRLDRLLERAISVAQILYESAVPDHFSGLQIQPEEVHRLLAQPPGKPLLWVAPDDSTVTSLQQNSSFADLANHFQLIPFDIDVILIALAPEFDLRYERIYAFLQDDITRRRPSVDLILNLLCETTEEKLLHRARFAPEAPLICNLLISLSADPQQPHSPLLSHTLKLDEQMIRWLLGETVIDVRLKSFCNCIDPDINLEQLYIDKMTKDALITLINETRTNHAVLKLYFHGRTGTGKRSIAEALALKNGSRLLSMDLRGALRSTEDLEHICLRLSREAWFQNAIVFIENLDTLNVEEHAYQLQCFREFIEDYSGTIILAGSDPEWIVRCGLSMVITAPISMPDYIDRRTLWQDHLENADISDADLNRLAQHFRLSPGQITAACRTAHLQANWNSASLSASAAAESKTTLSDLMQAARTQSGHTLTKLARKVTLNYRWKDLILPLDQRLQLEEICIQFTHRHIVYGNWGFGRKLSLGRGLNVMFAGPSGTGKTMAAEVIANELGLDLYKIDLSQVVSKYIGETEKNLDRIFTAAEDANAILFFDEADALFGKRSDVKDAHDRYANIEVGYLLQKMEEYEGIAILATNLRGHMDDAFVRRLQFIVEFPMPDEIYRQRIWEAMFPHETPLGNDVDFQVLARDIRVTGGSIKNIGLASAFYAAKDGGIIRMPHLLRAAHREYQKLGRSWNGLNGVPQ
jgi:SpoVK/Ycf46/Vps4 family AAA+-type ATPase